VEDNRLDDSDFDNILVSYLFYAALMLIYHFGIYDDQIPKFHSLSNSEFRHLKLPSLAVFRISHRRHWFPVAKGERRIVI